MRPTAILTLALLAATGSPAAAGDCDWVSRALEAAEESEPFASLRGAERSPAETTSTLIAPGFAPGSCAIGWYGVGFGEGPALWCRQSLAPPGLSGAGLANVVRACTGLDGASDPWPGVYRVSFDVGGTRIAIEESGAEGAHVGRWVEVVVRRLEAAP